VLRLPGAGTEALVDRSHEVHNHRIAAALGIAPPVVHGGADGLLVTRHIADATPLDATAVAAPSNLADLGAMLGKLHRSGCRFQGERHVFADLDRYIALAGPSEDGAIERLRREAEPARRVLQERAEALVPSHIDPSPANFIRGEGRLWLVDWEYAAMAEPGWDLAGVTVEGGLDVPCTAALLAAYGRPADDAGLARIALWRVALDLLAVAWARLRLQADGDRSLAAMIADRSSRASAYLASTDYRHALDALER